MNGEDTPSIMFGAALLLDTGVTPAASFAAEPNAADSEDHALRCGACGEAITSSAERTTRDDAFEHVFANPGGFVYRIGCFRKAPGCIERGEPTDFFTWFPGYAWSFALCRACAVHLGWRFTGRTDDFFGLILNHLRSA